MVLSCSTVPALDGVVALVPRTQDVRPAFVSASRQLSVGFEVHVLSTKFQSVQIELQVKFVCLQPARARNAAVQQLPSPTHEYRTVFELPLIA